MNFEKIGNAALVRGEKIVLTDGASAVELLASARYETDCSAMRAAEKLKLAFVLPGKRS